MTPPAEEKAMEMAEWSGTLTRIQAISILDHATDKDDPFWEGVVQDFYDEEANTLPTIMDVLAALGVTEAEWREASHGNTTWPAPIHAAIPDGEVADLEKIALGFDSNAREARNEKNKCKPFQKGLRDQWAWGERSWTRQAVTIRQAIARLTALEAENAALEAEVAEARAKAIEECAKIADAHKGQAARDRAKKPKPFGGWSDEVFVEERGENIAAEVIAVAIRSQGEQER